jgi:UDPglucose 6-dehydrogenase
MHDPEAGKNFLAEMGDTSGATLFDDMYETAKGAHALLLCTEWRQYRSPDFERLRQLMAEPVLLDGRNQWDREQIEPLGFRYAGVGR